MSKPFIDSNIILYLLSSDILKADKAASILEAGGVISVQVLNEVVSVCQRKLKMHWDEIDAVLQAVKASVSNSIEYFPLISAQFFPLYCAVKRDFYDA